MSSYAVVAHDAGAANLLLHYIKFSPEFKRSGSCEPILSGPAKIIWSRLFPNMPSEDRLDTLVNRHSVVLSGTGWASDFEHRARVRANAMGVRTIAILDHWVNYAARFERMGTTLYPDEIWVFDEEAKRLAEVEFPRIQVTQKENYYWKSQARFSGGEICYDYLYVSEPARSDWGRGRPGEFQALEFFLEGLQKGAMSSARRLLFRLHPSETIDKYMEALEAFRAQGISVDIDDGAELGESIARSRQVVGCASAALALALYVGKPVTSVLPPHAPACCLPHLGLFHLREALGS